jgi:hypothetical protein
MSTYVCSSPQSNYDYVPDQACAQSPDDFKATARANSRRVRSKDQSPEVILVGPANQHAGACTRMTNLAW